ncbi:hypothetical protein ACLM5H_05395 [Fredinandcohnia humi]
MYHQLEEQIVELTEKQLALEVQLEGMEKEEQEILDITVTEQEAVEFYQYELKQTS